MDRKLGAQQVVLVVLMALAVGTACALTFWGADDEVQSPDDGADEELAVDEPEDEPLDPDQINCSDNRADLENMRRQTRRFDEILAAVESALEVPEDDQQAHEMFRLGWNPKDWDPDHLFELSVATTPAGLELTAVVESQEAGVELVRRLKTMEELPSIVFAGWHRIDDEGTRLAIVEDPFDRLDDRREARSADIDCSCAATSPSVPSQEAWDERATEDQFWQFDGHRTVSDVERAELPDALGMMLEETEDVDAVSIAFDGDDVEIDVWAATPVAPTERSTELRAETDGTVSFPESTDLSPSWTPPGDWFGDFETAEWEEEFQKVRLRPADVRRSGEMYRALNDHIGVVEVASELAGPQATWKAVLPCLKDSSSRESISIGALSTTDDGAVQWTVQTDDGELDAVKQPLADCLETEVDVEIDRLESGDEPKDRYSATGGDANTPRFLSSWGDIDDGKELVEEIIDREMEALAQIEEELIEVEDIFRELEEVLPDGLEMESVMSVLSRRAAQANVSVLDVDLARIGCHPEASAAMDGTVVVAILDVAVEASPEAVIHWLDDLLDRDRLVVPVDVGIGDVDEVESAQLAAFSFDGSRDCEK